MASLIILAVVIAVAHTSKHVQAKSKKGDQQSLSATANKSTYDLGRVEYNMNTKMYSNSPHPSRYPFDNVASESEYSPPAYHQIANYHPAEFEVLMTENVAAVGDSKLTPTSK
ncbi:uncharacterized protein K444DRAFT_668313 [Hyaloscypha bicolor E]|uniref:Uncharacterized protein n=1 Tax=Hyaloscypha bicolor E TaxID=1095630 RepID=A0A2J6SR13_9HELO|nr:uncharacterized protein K444DRAFT_668313 [Hyaloscypha bicolor E]PMD53221.1 hypothetical protein K444DRAFT_668313 [Hyaloscypha bicolor E]